MKQWDEATAYFERARRLARFSLAEARSSVHALRDLIGDEPIQPDARETNREDTKRDGELCNHALLNQRAIDQLRRHESLAHR